MSINKERFNERLDYLHYLIKEAKLGDEDKERLKLLSELVDDYEDTVFFKKLYDNSDNIIELKNKIDLYIKTFSVNSTLLEEVDFLGDDNRANEVRNIGIELSDFSDSHCVYNKNRNMRLFNIFSSGLDDDTTFFGDYKIIDGEKYNNDLVNSILNILADKSLMRDLRLVTDDCFELIRCDIIKNHLKSALEHEKALRDNIDLISEYHNIRGNLNNESITKKSDYFDIKFFKNQLAKKKKEYDSLNNKLFKTDFEIGQVHELKREIGNIEEIINSFSLSDDKKESIKRLNEISEVFEKDGIKDFVIKAYQDNDNEKDLSDLENSNFLFSYVTNMEQLDNYFEDVRSKLSVYELLYSSIRTNLKIHFDEASPKAKDLLQNNLFTCYNIVNLTRENNNYGIKKSYCLLGMDILFNLDNAKYSDFDNSSSGDDKINYFIDMKRDFIREEIDAKCLELNNKLTGVIHPKNGYIYSIKK